jgi:uncharacterized membrane-anchored protein
MIIRITFRDAQIPKVLNLSTGKYFFPDERGEMKCEAARLLREKGITRKFTIEKELK